MPKVTSAEFRWTQVALKCSHIPCSQIWSPHSSCDSRNLNLSPFCKLTSTSLAMWQQSILETYGNQTTTYIDGISGPMRLNFPYSMKEKELITSLTKVLLCWDLLQIQLSNFSGCDLLQRLRERHCHCEHILWRTNSLWWGHLCLLLIGTTMHFRVREIPKHDLVGLHLRLWRPLWALSWDQLCLCRWDLLLVLYQAL